MRLAEGLVLPCSVVVSVSGKGGVGKTTFTALLLRGLTRLGGYEVLAIDADPAMNLPSVLGCEVKESVGDLIERLEKEVDPDEVTASFEQMVWETITENKGFDLLAMGFTEREGCYCTVNRVLARIVDSVTMFYDLVLMDMEAGLEHLSRRTDRDVDVFFIVTDPSRMGLQTAGRIINITKTLHINFKHMYLVGNRFPETAERTLYTFAEENGVRCAAFLPFDPNVSRFNLQGKPLLELPDDSPILSPLKNIIENCIEPLL